MTTSSSDNIKSPILKKPIRVSDTMVVVPIHESPILKKPIDESLVKKLPINEETWFEEIPTSEGIFLRIASRKIGSCHDVIEKQTGQESSLTNVGCNIRQTFPGSRIRAEVILHDRSTSHDKRHFRPHT